MYYTVIFPRKKMKIKNKNKMPNKWRTINSLVHSIRLHGRRGKEMAESFSQEKLRQAPQKEGGYDLPPVCVTPDGMSTNLTSRINGMTTHTHTHTHFVAFDQRFS